MLLGKKIGCFINHFCFDSHSFRFHCDKIMVSIFPVRGTTPKNGFHPWWLDSKNRLVLVKTSTSDFGDPNSGTALSARAPSCYDKQTWRATWFPRFYWIPKGQLLMNWTVEIENHHTACKFQCLILPSQDLFLIGSSHFWTDVLKLVCILLLLI